MHFRTKMIALAVFAVFLASVGAANVASAGTNNLYLHDTTLVITGYGQITQPGKPIPVGGMLFSGSSPIAGMTVKVYAQRLGTFSLFGTEIGRPSAPVLVATATTDVNGFWGSITTSSVSLSQQGDYYVYAVYEGAYANSNYYYPSQSEMMAVKVTKVPTSLILRKPTLTLCYDTSNDYQAVFLGDSIHLGTSLRSFGNTAQEGGVVWNKPLSLYYQYKRPDSDTWSAPVLIAKDIYRPGGLSFVYKPTQEGYYRFQVKFAGDPTSKMIGYDASASNYVKVFALRPTITPAK
jgi:hypothetical protein